MPKKVYVIDTNVIINDPLFVKKLKGQILIPTTVLHELDAHKYGHTDKSKKVREFARFLDKNRDSVWFHNSDNFEGTNDEKIIKTAINLKAKGENVILVTNDILMGLLAKGLGIEVKKHDIDFMHENRKNIYPGVFDERESDLTPSQLIKKRKFNENDYILLNNGIFRYSDGKLIRIKKYSSDLFIRHKNLEQRCAIDALLNDDIKLVTISGKAGTGKTLLSLATGLYKVVSNRYDKVIVSRPVIPMGQDLGFLPGEIENKIQPWMQPIFDNVEYLFKSPKARDGLIQDGLLQIEALTYIRGRSIPNQFIIVDEAQNLTKHEVKTIISRAGENTKIVLTGDMEQIDNGKLDFQNNGLYYTIQKFKTQKIAAHIHLSKCERSELAEIASSIL